MIVLHIIIALFSIVITSVAFLAVAKWALRAAYGSAALTLLSGIYLVVAMPARMLHLCVAGVFYLAVVSLGILLARRRIIRTHNVVARR